MGSGDHPSRQPLEPSSLIVSEADVVSANDEPSGPKPTVVARPGEAYGGDWLPRRGAWVGPLTVCLAFVGGMAAAVLLVRAGALPGVAPPPAPAHPTLLPEVAGAPEPTVAGALPDPAPPAVAATAPAPQPVAATAPAAQPAAAAAPAAQPVAAPLPAPGSKPAAEAAPRRTGAGTRAAAAPAAPQAPALTPGTKAPAASPPPAAPGEPLLVEVTSDPPGAMVHSFAGALGQTPLTAVLPPDRATTLELRLPGYRSAAVRWSPSDGTTKVHRVLVPENAP